MRQRRNRRTGRFAWLLGIAAALIIPAACTPAPVPSSPRIVDMAAGGQTCAFFSDGLVKCWGANSTASHFDGTTTMGSVGDGTTTDRHTPVDVVDLSGVDSVSAQWGTACATTTADEVYCWGPNEYGQIGDGTLVDRPSPVRVLGLSSVSKVDVGGRHTCAIVAEGRVKCWGQNTWGTLGDGTYNDSVTPVDVSGVVGATDIAAGGWHTCVLVEGGAVDCWGHGWFYGASFTENSTPYRVPGISGATEISAGDGHVCVLADNQVRCWGWNRFGQIGDGTLTNPHPQIHTITEIRDPVRVAAGPAHTCALEAAGTVKCWGHNLYGEVGDGTFVQRLSPTEVIGITEATDLVVGYDTSCALELGGMKCWGGNAEGQLGDGTTTDSALPVDVIGL